MHTKVKRILFYLIMITVTITTGLLSRSGAIDRESFVGQFAGDTLWAAMVYWGMALLFLKKGMRVPLVASLLFSFGIEFSQFSQAEWLMNLRATTLGALVLGHGFLLSDLICYSVGIAIASSVDLLFRQTIQYESSIPVNCEIGG